MAGAAPAYAGADLRLIEPEARSGDAVHFLLQDVDEDETYVIEVGDRKVAEGRGSEAEEVSGQFAMPELGGAHRKVTVEAEIAEPGERRKTVKRKIQYLGAAAPIAEAPAPPPAPAPAAVPQPAPALEPAHLLPPGEVPGAELPSGQPSQARSTPRSRRPSREAREQQTTARQTARRRSANGGHRSRTRRPASKRPRTKRPAPRTAPLFDGVPESGFRSGGGPTGGIGFSGLSAIVPPTAALTAAPGSGDGGALGAAVLVPALLGLAALLLAGTALVRARR